MFNQTLSLNATRDIIANNVSLILGNDVVNILDLFLQNGTNSPYYTKTYIDNLISNYLTQNQVNALIGSKLDVTAADNLYYNKTYVDNLISSYSTTTQINTLLTSKVDTTTFNTGLALKQNIINNGDLDVTHTNGLQGFLDVHTAGIAGLNVSLSNLTNNFYTKVVTDGLIGLKTDSSLFTSVTNNLDALITTNTSALASKQSNLSNNGGAGIPLLVGDNLRQIMATAPLSALIYYNFADVNDADNNNIQLDIDLSSIQTQIDDKQDSLDNGNDITIDFGQGEIYFEKNPVGNDGTGLVIRTSDNPLNNPILSVKSSGLSSRLWAGQSITSPGANDFHCGYTGANDEEHLTTNYKHKLTDTVVEFNTPVTCGFDLTCGDLTANSIYGGVATQIQSLIDTAIINAYPYWVAGKVYSAGSIAVSQGRVGFTSSRFSAGVYDITFDTVHPRGTHYVINLTNESRLDWSAKTSGVYNVTNNGFRVILQYHDSVEHNSVFYISVLA